MRGFIWAKNVQLPVSMTEASVSVQGLTWLLQCFEGPSKEGWEDEKDKLFSLQGEKLFKMPLQWLATMIIRGCADIDDLLETILRTKNLGDLDLEEYREWEQHCPKAFRRFECNIMEGSVEEKGPGFFGFWLPHGIQVSDEEFTTKIREGLKRFTRIEELYREWFAIRPERLCTEKEQQWFFAANPQKFPEKR